MWTLTHIASLPSPFCLCTRSLCTRGETLSDISDTKSPVRACFVKEGIPWRRIEIAREGAFALLLVIMGCRGDGDASLSSSPLAMLTGGKRRWLQRRVQRRVQAASCVRSFTATCTVSGARKLEPKPRRVSVFLVIVPFPGSTASVKFSS